MVRKPDEDNDVIVRQFRRLDEDGAGRDTWTVSIGDEKQGDRDSLRAATELACHLATLHSRPAWLLDETGCPLQPIEPWNRPLQFPSRPRLSLVK